MKFAVMMWIRNPPRWARPVHEVYRESIELGVLAEQLGFDTVWSCEHHFTDDQWSPSQLLVLSAIAARTESIRLGTAVLLMPFHHPLRAAEDLATLDIISNGRLNLGVGPGSHPGEFETFGIPIKQRRPRMYDGLEIVKRCFSEESFDWKSKYWEFNQVRMTTKPIQHPIPIYIGAVGEKALFEAGARGYNLVGPGTPERRGTYEAGLRSAGHDPRNFERALMENLHTASTRDQAWDEAEAHLHYTMSWHYAMFESEAGMKETHKDIQFNIPPVGELRKSGRSYFGQAMVGAPDEVAQIVDRRITEMAPTEVILSVGFAGMDPRHTRNSVELFAKEIMPHFRNR
jgi:alkanesulfonate monooxygenase SsuD/methylene tetrahydromethanopterin reductase-like flavin-dependent oxidoreductase (luciferase family)